MIDALLFWLILLLVFMTDPLGARRTAATMAAPRGPSDAPPPGFSPEALAALESRLAPMLAIRGHKAVGNVVQFTGHLGGKTDEMFRKISDVFAGEPVTPLLVEGEEDDMRLVVLPGNPDAKVVEKPKWVLHWLLFFATIATTTWAGALHAGVKLLQQPECFAVGLPYSLCRIRGTR